MATNWKLQLVEEQPNVLICFCRNTKNFYTVSGSTGKVIGANQSKRVHRFEDILSVGDEMILKGELILSSEETSLKGAQFSFFNWACRPYYCVWKERDTSKRLHKAGRKLGYELMWYDSVSQVNLFFSRRNKRVLLRCKTKNSYD